MSNLLEKIDLIKKYAQEDDSVPKRTSVKAPVETPKKPSEVPHRGVPQKGIAPMAGPAARKLQKSVDPKYQRASIEAIKEMQLAMQRLGQSVMADAVSGTMAEKPQYALQPMAVSQVRSSKKGFNDFIAEQYLGSLEEDKKGVEWSNDPKITSLPGKKRTQTDIYELDAVMDTLRRIGSSTKEFSVDGKWDFRTDNSLRNIMGFAYALLQLEGDFGLKNDEYSFDDWQMMKKLLSGYSTKNGVVSISTAGKLVRASKLTTHINSITKLYNHFRQQVLARPEFRPTLEGKRYFDRYNNKGLNKDVLTPEEDQMTKSDSVNIPVTYLAPGIPARRLDHIPLKALKSKEEYLKWMVDYAGNSTESAINIFNKVIKPKIESM